MPGLRSAPSPFAFAFCLLKESSVATGSAPCLGRRSWEGPEESAQPCGAAQHPTLGAASQTLLIVAGCAGNPHVLELLPFQQLSAELLGGSLELT